MRCPIKLMENAISKKDMNSAITRCLETEYYTQGEIVAEFEKKFAQWNGTKYAVMVNSGSSANMLMIDYMKMKYDLKNEDEILVPDITWPTTVCPIIQRNLSPVFCDVDGSFNIDIDSMKRMISSRTRGVFGVHLLGQPIKLDETLDFCRRNGLFFIEDCCESQGAKHDGKKVGNFGEMGSFSFYFGHHMTTVEGGMIVTNDFEAHDFLRSMRNHGMVRDTNREGNYPGFENNRFVFDVLGYNLRSTNINAAIGLTQLKNIDGSLERRLENHKRFLHGLEGIPIIPQTVNLDETSSFSLAIVFPDQKTRESALRDLPKIYGIECRPVVAGNLLKQPLFRNTNYRRDSEDMANIVHWRGIYLPNNQFIGKDEIDYMIDSVKKI